MQVRRHGKGVRMGANGARSTRNIIRRRSGTVAAAGMPPPLTAPPPHPPSPSHKTAGVLSFILIMLILHHAKHRQAVSLSTHNQGSRSRPCNAFTGVGLSPVAQTTAITVSNVYLASEKLGFNKLCIVYSLGMVSTSSACIRCFHI